MIGLWIVGCHVAIHHVPSDQACLETGYAISRRTFECTGDADLANARYHSFEAATTCIEEDFAGLDTSGPYDRDLFHCAFTISELPCELVATYGDDIGAWLKSSEMCPYVVEMSP